MCSDYVDNTQNGDDTPINIGQNGNESPIYNSQNGGHAESDEEITVNPCPPEWIGDEENGILRVDAIGDTAYTHRWVLKCLNTVTKSLSNYIVVRNETAKNEADNMSSEASSSEEEDADDSFKIVELDSDVEDAVCQLWDMTTSLDVIKHILNLEEVNILELANMIIEYSRSPRLTEVILGVVANISCQEFGVKKVLDMEKSCNIVNSILNLLSSTNDVQSLCEAFRFLCALVHYRACKSEEPSDMFLPSWEALCQRNVQKAIVFILQNSLSDDLVNRVLDFLSRFINFSEPSINIAEIYGQQELVHTLMNVLHDKYEKFKEHHSEVELEPMRHCIACIYAFLGKKAICYLMDDLNKTKIFESDLVYIVEYEAKIESVTDLNVLQTKNIWTSITLLKFLIPLINKPSVISLIGRLLSIIYGQTHQYTVTRSTSKEELNTSNEHLAFNEFSDFFELNLAEKIEKEKVPIPSSLQKEFRLFSEPEKMEDFSNTCDPYANRNDSPATVHSGWLSPSPTKDTRRVDMKLKSVPKTDDEYTHEELEDLKEVLADYSCDLFSWWWDSKNKNGNYKAKQNSILVALDQCHVHEVIFILDCVRRKAPILVAELQEKLLDKGKHLRLVAILSHMYQ